MDDNKVQNQTESIVAPTEANTASRQKEQKPDSPQPETIQEPVEQTPESPQSSETASNDQEQAPESLHPEETPGSPGQTSENSQPGEISDNPEQAPDPQKQKKKLIIASVALFLLAAVGVTAAILLSNQNPDTSMDKQSESTEETISAIDPASIKMTGNTLSDFDLAFLKLENNNNNVIYSPLSIKYALAMLADGSAGESKEQITNIIGDYKPTAYLNSENRSIANAMMVKDDFADNVKQSYANTINEKYNASLVLDSFATPDNANKWVSDKTLGIIDNLFDQSSINEDVSFVLINALAIDMKWNNQIQCVSQLPEERTVPCKNLDSFYSVEYPHESHGHTISEIFDHFKTHEFADSGEIEVGEIGADANRYDIIAELGEDYIRETVLNSYQEWLADLTEEEKANFREFDIEEYMSALKSNYGKIDSSTDFYYNDTDDEKVFAKDLQEYDGKTLQYVGIMPKNESLQQYVKTITAEKATNLISNLKDSSDINSFKEGVVTSISGSIPFFKYNYEIKSLISDLKAIGITDVFNNETADLSEMLTFTKDDSVDKPYIDSAVHAADIDFSNYGITAAAATGMGGRGAAGGGFDYVWDVPVEKIDLTFDQPFMYIIRDKDSGEVWFAGTLCRKGE